MKSTTKDNGWLENLLEPWSLYTQRYFYTDLFPFFNFTNNLTNHDVHSVGINNKINLDVGRSLNKSQKTYMEVHHLTSTELSKKN